MPLNNLNGPLFKDLKVLCFKHFTEVTRWIYENHSTTTSPSNLLPPTLNQLHSESTPPNFDDMILDEDLERIALLIAVGQHSLMLYGTPGTGKSMFSERIASILPPLSSQTHLEVLKIHSSMSEHIPSSLLAGVPPFRSPHHQTSAGAVMGIPENPGEISLAHGGILFLDELPEFRRDILESLREPLETGHIQVSRARHKVTWHARSILVAACNLCPCGWYGSHKRRCTCPTSKILAYRRKVSGPILDRIDLHHNLLEPKKTHAELFKNLGSEKQTKTSVTLKSQVGAAIEFSKHRSRSIDNCANAQIKPKNLATSCGLNSDCLAKLIEETIPEHASPRSVIRSLRVARTLADLKEQPIIVKKDLATAWKWQAEPSARARGDHTLGLI